MWTLIDCSSSMVDGSQSNPPVCGPEFNEPLKLVTGPSAGLALEEASSFDPKNKSKGQACGSPICNTEMPGSDSHVVVKTKMQREDPVVQEAECGMALRVKIRHGTKKLKEKNGEWA